MHRVAPLLIMFALTRPVQALIALSLLTAGRASAQSPNDRTQISAAVLSAWEHSLRSKTCAYCAGELIFETLVLRGTWEHGVAHDPVPPRSRDAGEVAILAGALRGKIATAELVAACGVANAGCPFTSRTARSVAISDPRISGDTATLLLRDAGPNLLGNDTVVGGMTISVQLARVIRTNGVWVVRCIVLAANDFALRPALVEEKCAEWVR